MRNVHFSLPLFVSLIVFLGAPRLQAQTEIGVMGGVSLYSGDLSPQEIGLYFQDVRPAFGAFARFGVGRAFALRAGVSAGTVTADASENGLALSGLSFRSRITEFSLVGELNLFTIGQRIAPYVFGGGAVFRFSPEAEFDGDFVQLQPLGTEGQGLPGYDAPYSLTQWAIPLGLGVKILLSDQVTLGLEFGGRKLFTDYLDDVSANSFNYGDVLEGNGELAARLSLPFVEDPDLDGSYSRGGDYDDWYYIGGVSLSFRLSGGSRGSWNSGRGIGCPTF
ncbi:DUF6089 family protein [Phaeodactylibacter luteus]|nr:DUF6089 family protein [Phaeodactylibacter luteus]